MEIGGSQAAGVAAMQMPATAGATVAPAL